MSSTPSRALARRPAEVRWTATLAALGAWTITVPWLGRLLGLHLDVATRVEVVDHVVPGTIVAAAGFYLTSVARRRALAVDRFAVLAAGAALLAGAWVLATHVPLLVDAARADQPWRTAIWHSVTALPIVVLALWGVLRATSEP